MRKRFTEEQTLVSCGRTTAVCRSRNLAWLAAGDSHGQQQGILWPAMLTWAHDRSVRLFLIQPCKPNQNAYIESFSGRLWDECLNER